MSALFQKKKKIQLICSFRWSEGKWLTCRPRPQPRDRPIDFLSALGYANELLMSLQGTCVALFLDDPLEVQLVDCLVEKI